MATMGDPMSGSWVSGETTAPGGSRVAYRRYGTGGPKVILVHGGVQAAQNLHLLAGALSDQFVAYVPDRRGRGRSGPPGDRYGLAAERDDLAALVRHSNATRLFGLSPGGIIVLSAARILPDVVRVAAYEPPPSIDHSTPLGWLPRYERELARDDLAAAAVTAMRGTRTASLAVRLAPRRLLTAVLKAAIVPRRDTGRPTGTTWRATAARFLLWPLRRAAPGAGSTGRSRAEEVSLRALIPTMRHDAQLVAESEGTLEDYRALTAPVLLLGGTRSARYLRRTLDSLQRVLPDVTRVGLPGAGHTAPDNRGEPLRVAGVLRQFFGADDAAD